MEKNSIDEEEFFILIPWKSAVILSTILMLYYLNKYIIKYFIHIYLPEKVSELIEASCNINRPRNGLSNGIKWHIIVYNY